MISWFITDTVSTVALNWQLTEEDQRLDQVPVKVKVESKA